MKKALGQTVRDLKRGVNKKVLKIPGVEQKVLDATSNEPWGPHGSHMADIAQASRNYHEYQMIMAVIWKRINDTGKNWRHVYKALIVLEYLVANGSERVIDEIREHAYQISTLSDFQYIDSSGRDQGSNVRKKSQSLVTLVNDKERIQEARQKAAANRDKFRNASSAGGLYRPGSNSSSGGYGDRYDDDHYEGRYGSRDEERNDYGRDREREWGYRDDDRYSRDSYGRDGDRYGRDSDERYGRDGYRDDDYRGRSRSNDDYQYGSRSRSSDIDRDRGSEDDGRYSSRSSGARAEEYSQDGRRLERKYSEQNISAPSYEEAVNDAQSPRDERNGEAEAAPVPKAFSPAGSASQSPFTAAPETAASSANQDVDGFDEFDPRGSVSGSSVSGATLPNATPPNSSNAEMDLLGGLAESFTSNQLAIMPASSSTTNSVADSQINAGSEPTFVALSAPTALDQSIEDPFGDSPFKATPAPDSIPGHQQAFTPNASFQSTMSQSSEPLQPSGPKTEAVSGFDFADTFQGITYSPSNLSNVQATSTSQQFLPPGLSTANQNDDILADILPPSGTNPVASQPAFPGPTSGSPALPSNEVFGNFPPQSGSLVPVTSQAALQAPTGPPTQASSGNFYAQTELTVPVAAQAVLQAPIGPPSQPSSGNFYGQSGLAAPVTSQAAFQAPFGPSAHPSSNFLGNMLSQRGSAAPAASQPAAAPTPTSKAQTQKDKFDPKSTVWADTLNRGLVNLNISGPKTNPLADIGIDFEAINRKEKRMEKPAANTVTSTITMGKAMGSGSGIGRAGASALAPTPNSMVGSGMGMGGAGMRMGMNMGAPGVGMNMGMGGYGGAGMNQPMGMGMNAGMGMNMGMGQAPQVQTPAGLPPGPTMPGGYNPMMGMGGYPQQPYGGYR